MSKESNSLFCIFSHAQASTLLICSIAQLKPNPFIVMVSYSDETPVLSLAVIFHPARVQGQIGVWLRAVSEGEWVGGTLVLLQGHDSF